jgi:hypothetical protein
VFSRGVRATLLALGIAAAMTAWWYLQPEPDRVVLDLVNEVPRAKARRPSPDVFSITTAALGTERRRSIYTTTSSRITWDVAVPAASTLKVSIGLTTDAWAIEGDGVLFVIGVSDPSAGQYVELFRRVVNPFGRQDDRRWFDVALDLSPYSGKTVELVFNASAGGPGPATSTGDLALWGEPRIVR